MWKRRQLYFWRFHVFILAHNGNEPSRFSLNRVTKIFWRDKIRFDFSSVTSCRTALNYKSYFPSSTSSSCRTFQSCCAAISTSIFVPTKDCGSVSLCEKRSDAISTIHLMYLEHDLYGRRLYTKCTRRTNAGVRIVLLPPSTPVEY